MSSLFEHIRKSLLIIAWVLSFTSLNAQSKQDYHWFFGTDQNLVQEGIQGLYFDFNQAPIEARVHNNALNFTQNNASIADTSGNLLFYTNGCAIANRHHELMMNGDSLNYNSYFEVFWEDDCSLGYPGIQDLMILNDPADADGYYLIHKPRDYDPDSTPSTSMRELQYSYIDMSDGLGVVTEKNKVIDSKVYLWSYLTAINHSNGTDWWIIQPKDRDNINYIYKLDAQGISLHDSTSLGNKAFVENTSSSGQAKFSPDGTMYAFYNYYDGLYLYDFDRSTAEFSNFRVLETPETEEIIFGGMEFSPNSEFIYFTNSDSLFQVDLAYQDLKDGLVLIDTYDGVLDPFGTQFNFATLGPDCRIYIRPSSSSNVFHVINKPDEKASACEFVERGIKLPQVSSVESWPNHPRFRVDEDAPCDPSISTFLGPSVQYRKVLDISHNPVQSNVTVKLPENIEGYVEVINAQGQLVHNRVKVNGLEKELHLNLGYIPAGYYLIRLVPNQNEGYFYDAKIVKQ